MHVCRMVVVSFAKKRLIIQILIRAIHALIGNSKRNDTFAFVAILF